MMMNNEQATPAQDNNLTAEERKQAMELIMNLQKQIEELKNAQAAASTVKKNQKPSQVHVGRKYVILAEALPTWGKVPQQQADIAAILNSVFEVGVEYTEEEVFTALSTYAMEYNSLATSKQDVTYLFRYYRGLAAKGNHAGFIARNWLRQIN